jgi:hypothetical protein
VAENGRYARIDMRHMFAHVESAFPTSGPP